MSHHCPPARRPGLATRRHVLFLATTSLVAIARPGRARASLVLAMELPEMTASADAIVVAKVVGMRSWRRPGEKAIFTEVKLQVAESWKGQLSGNSRTISVVHPGGEVDGIEMHVHGLPSFSHGEEAVLFLDTRVEHRPDLGFTLTGLGQGKRRLFRQDGRLMAAPSDRSAAVLKDALGRWQAAPPEPAIPLDDLRQQVRLLLESRR